MAAESKIAVGTYTRALGAYIAGNHDVVLPETVMAKMKLYVLDAIGCGILGSHFPWTLPVLNTAIATEPEGPALVWGHSQSFSPAIAAMINGTFVHGFETDDVGPAGHPGSVSVPVALALAQGGAELNGLDLIRSLVTGVEVGARVRESTKDIPHIRQGFHGPGLFGTFVAVSTASYVLGLTAQQCVYAIGNAAQFTGGLMGTDKGGMGKRLLMGKAAHSGTMAAQLAAHGFENVENIFECGYGSFPSAFCGSRDEFDLTKLTDGLGTVFRSEGVNFKMWSCRAPIHPTLEAIKTIRQQRTLSADDIERIDVPMDQRTFQPVGWQYAPATITSAQMNLQYCVAVMLLDNEVFIDQFTEEMIRSPKVLELVDRIHTYHDESLDPNQMKTPRTSRFEITLKSGEKIQAFGTHRSAGSDPVTDEEVIAKFRSVTRSQLPPEAQDKVIELCSELESVKDARELLEPLRLAK